MKLCVGAVSRRVVEVAAELNVPQIIASRRQVDIGRGYTGYDQEGLVKAVRARSSTTKIVRDHGGPGMSGLAVDTDDDVESFEADIAAGFDILHVDVCKLPDMEQGTALAQRLDKLANRVDVEVGGEHDSARHNMGLLRTAQMYTDRVVACVVDTGGHIGADTQRGFLRPVKDVGIISSAIRGKGVEAKAHNQDWFGARLAYADVLDSYNIAPEFGQVEVEACLDMLEPKVAETLLVACYATNAWTRWFGALDGTWRQRATCALRYCMELPWAANLLQFGYDRETYVREAIRDAILRG